MRKAVGTVGFYVFVETAIRSITKYVKR